MQLWRILAAFAVVIIFGFCAYGLSILLDKLDPVSESKGKEDKDEEVH